MPMIEEFMKFVDILLNPYTIKILILFTIISIIYYFTLIFKMNKIELNKHNILLYSLSFYQSMEFT